MLRYSLTPGSLAQAFAYMRAVQALDRSRDGDVAGGLAVRPLAGVPVTAHGEMRVSRRSGRVELRPAAFVAGGFDAVPLIRGIAARGYAQAGFVGGRDATGFVDGSLVAETQAVATADYRLALGTGVWGGAQRGSGRLDIGPSASLNLRVGDGSARLSADYRVRVAGKAAPSDGVALTLSAGF